MNTLPRHSTLRYATPCHNIRQFGPDHKNRILKLNCLDVIYTTKIITPNRDRPTVRPIQIHFKMIKCKVLALQL